MSEGKLSVDDLINIIIEKGGEFTEDDWLNISEDIIGRLIEWPPHWVYDFANVVIVDPESGRFFYQNKRI